MLEPCRKVINAEFDLDPCSNSTSLVNAAFNFTLPFQNGLLESWDGFEHIFINPPYGRSYIHYVTRAVISQKEYSELDKNEKKLYYGQNIAKWISKANETNLNNPHNHTFLLIPAAVDTKPWQEIIFPAHRLNRASICFLKGRVTFIGADAGSPMALTMVYYGDRKPEFLDTFSEFGYVI